MDRTADAGRQQTMTTEENENLIKYSICSEDVNPGRHMSLRNVGKNLYKGVVLPLDEW